MNTCIAGRECFKHSVSCCRTGSLTIFCISPILASQVSLSGSDSGDDSNHKTTGTWVTLFLCAQVIMGYCRPALPPKTETLPTTPTTNMAQQQQANGSSYGNDFNPVFYADPYGNPYGQSRYGQPTQSSTQPEPPKSCMRRVFEISHRILGALLLIGAWVTVETGMQLYQSWYGQPVFPLGQLLFWAAALGITGLSLTFYLLLKFFPDD